MNSKIPVLPRITKVKLVGYKPLFKQTIDVQITNNRLLVLGGNGMGKTTILQSIIYCIAGESDSSIEAVKSKRWGRKYFFGRIANPEDAHIEVDVYLDQDRIVLKRGFKNSRLLKFNLNGKSVTGYTKADAAFSKYIEESTGYRSTTNFRYVIHKLCYLPEDRPNLVWDSENQTRLMMLLFNDLINESEFNERRKQLKVLDSARRHKNVAFRKAKKNLESTKQKIIATTLEFKEEGKLEVDQKQAPHKEDDDEILILRRLGEFALEKNPIQENNRESNKLLSDLTVEVEDLQNRLAEKEESLILDQLEHYQSNEVELALHKLIHLHICPACGEKAEELAQKAQKYEIDDCCSLCGSKRATSDKELFPILDAQLSEKVEKKLILEKKIISNEKRLVALIKEEEHLQYRYNKIKLSQEDSYPDSSQNNDYDPGYRDSELELKQEAIEESVSSLEKEYLELNRSFDILKSELDEKYTEFTKIASERITRLGELYEEYATSFLGIPCKLDTKDADVEFLFLVLYVPNFDGKIRPSSDTCSEAQRFFLDIAFRMAVIDLAKELTKAAGTLICETPENTLDVTYIDNVGKMFSDFSNAGHTLIATGNLQYGGLGGHLLFDIKESERENSTINLLDYGKLSAVQQKNITALEGAYREFIYFQGG